MLPRFFLKKYHLGSAMDVKLKMKNMQLWVMDYNFINPEERAQILSLEFMHELYYNADSKTLYTEYTDKQEKVQ
jgi:hypothetical protein